MVGDLPERAPAQLAEISEAHKVNEFPRIALQ